MNQCQIDFIHNNNSNNNKYNFEKYKCLFFNNLGNNFYMESVAHHMIRLDLVTGAIVRS